MPDSSADGVEAARADAGVSALAVDAGAVAGAVVVHDTLRVAAEAVAASAVRSARVGLARVVCNRWRFFCK